MNAIDAQDSLRTIQDSQRHVHRAAHRSPGWFVVAFPLLITSAIALDDLPSGQAKSIVSLVVAGLGLLVSILLIDHYRRALSIRWRSYPPKYHVVAISLGVVAAVMMVLARIFEYVVLQPMGVPLPGTTAGVALGLLCLAALLITNRLNAPSAQS